MIPRMPQAHGTHTPDDELSPRDRGASVDQPSRLGSGSGIAAAAAAASASAPAGSGSVDSQGLSGGQGLSGSGGAAAEEVRQLRQQLSQRDAELETLKVGGRLKLQKGRLASLHENGARLMLPSPHAFWLQGRSCEHVHVTKLW